MYFGTGLPKARSVFAQTERITGNLMCFCTGLPKARSVFVQTERTTGNLMRYKD